MNGLVGERVKKILLKNSVPIVLVLMCVAFAFRSDKFLTVSNAITVLRQISMLCIISCGVMMVMVSGGIDLSVGSVASFSGLIWCICLVNNVSGIISFFVCILCGAIFGWLNGMIITFTRMNPMIATLGTSMVIQGAAFIMCGGGNPIYGLPESAKKWGQGTLGGIPTPVLIMMICLAINAVIMFRTSLGRSFYACGSNVEATRLSGINSGRIQRISYTLSGAFTAFAGLIMMSRVASGQPNIGTEYQMNCLTACIVGGISAGGGTGNTFGVFIGALIIGIIDNGLTIIRVDEYWQQIARGCILIFAVAMDSVQRSKADKEKRKIKHSA